MDRIEEDAVKERDYQFRRDFIVRSIFRHLRYHCEELKKIETIIEQMLQEQEYQLQTLQGVHTVTACALISHIGDIGRFRNPIIRAYFESKVSEGKTKIQALLCIM